MRAFPRGWGRGMATSKATCRGQTRGRGAAGPEGLGGGAQDAAGGEGREWAGRTDVSSPAGDGLFPRLLGRASAREKRG